MSITEKGKSDRAVVQNLINNLRKFDETVIGEMNAMVSSKEHLAEAWRDEQYKQFSEFIDLLAKSLTKDLEVLREATDNLQRKLNIY